MSNQLAVLTSKLAARLDLGNGDGMIDTLKATAFKGQVSDQQMMALLIVANQYGLNPWTKEIYAFPDKNNGIVPVVGVDGWSRIINSHPQFDGIDFEQDEASCTCTIYRKDRSHAVRVTEYMIECKRNVGPWQSHPYRMLRHKALIQCARLAFGFVGIFDQDEAERIIEADSKVVISPTKAAEGETSSITKARQAILVAACDEAIKIFDGGAGDEIGAYEQVSGIDDSDEKMFIWNYLKPHSKLRSAIKRIDKIERETASMEAVTDVVDKNDVDTDIPI